MKKNKPDSEIDEVDKVIAIIHGWQIESNSTRNDGATQMVYYEKIRRVKEVLGTWEQPIRIIT
jgi:hypothetical protein